MAKLYRLLSFYYVFIFGLPFYLIGFEYLMRVLQGVQSDLIGVTLASSGLALLAEGLKTKPVSVYTVPSKLSFFIFSPTRFIVRYKYDEILFRISVFCLLICLLIWYYTCGLSLSALTNTDLSIEEMEIIKQQTLLLGGVNYLMGMVITVLKA